VYYVQPILVGLGRPVMHNVPLIISHLGPLVVYDVWPIIPGLGWPVVYNVPFTLTNLFLTYLITINQTIHI
jgi:hypothetical protein